MNHKKHHLREALIVKASGTGNVDTFVRKIQGFLNAGNIDGANSECDKQKGSVANVIKSGLKKYREMEAEVGMDVDQKTLAIQKDIEEATALEMPMLEQNRNSSFLEQATDHYRKTRRALDELAVGKPGII